MSKRSELDAHLHSLRDINEIFAAMKSLSLMESHKLARLLTAQQRVVASMESAASDFLAFHPALAPGPERGRRTYLLLGSERGFCGNFNEQLVDTFDRHRRDLGLHDYSVITVGRKLTGRFLADPHCAASLDGATAAEEVQPILLRLMDTLQAAQAREAPRKSLDLVVAYHDADREAVVIHPLQHFVKLPTSPVPFTHPPILNLDPVVFVTDLAELYLFAVLHQMFYSALMSEHRSRLLHMDGAMRRLGEELEELRLKGNILRQEEITEEIELIMLNAGALDQRP